jgi:hypothetical protein
MKATNALLKWAIIALLITAGALAVYGLYFQREQTEGFASDVASASSSAAASYRFKRARARNLVRITDELQMTAALNPVGQQLVKSNETTMCEVNGVRVNALETSVSLDSDIVSCTVSRFMLKPLNFSLSGSATKDTKALEAVLKQGAAVSAMCRPNSSVCTIEFSKDASTQELMDYNTMMSNTFGIASVNVSDVAGGGTMYVMLPNGRNGQEPKRVTIRVEPDGSKSFMVYKFSSVSTETPLDLWTSGGRNVDNDVALNADVPTMCYASDLLRESTWEAFQFSHIMVEARKGSSIISRLKFRATRDRQKWFHPKLLVSAEFGGMDAGSTFLNKAFEKFTMADAKARLYFCIMDENIVGGISTSASGCTQQKYYMCVPYRATACPEYDTLNGRVVTATEPASVKLKDYAASTTTHLVIWLVVSGSSIQKGGDIGAYTGPEGATGLRVPTLMEQSPPPGIFDGAAARPSAQSPVILSTNCGGAPGWELSLPAEGAAYTESRLRELLKEKVSRRVVATMTDTTSPSMTTMNRVRFQKGYRVVLFGEGRSLSPDAQFVAVLQDSRVAAASKPAQPTVNWNPKAPMNVRYPDGRTASIAYNESTADNDGTFIEACLSGPFDSAVRSIIVEKINDAPLAAATQCGTNKTWDVQAHVGHYDSGSHIDMMGNTFEVQNLKNFHVGAGYTVLLFPEKNYGGTAVTIRGPDIHCRPPNKTVMSMRILHGGA